MTITATLIEGEVTGGSIAIGDPLEGYALWCVTLEDAPQDAQAVADAAGVVQLTIAGLGVPIGCFVLALDETVVASVVFDDTTGRAQTVAFSEDIDVSILTVDLAQGLALASVDDTAEIIDTNAALPCPLGTWVMDPGVPTCQGPQPNLTVLHVTALPDGSYQSTTTVGPVVLNGICGTFAANLAASWEGGVLEVTYEEPGCPGQVRGTRVVPNDACDGADHAEGFMTNCASCDAFPDIIDCGCGTLTCTSPPVEVARP